MKEGIPMAQSSHVLHEIHPVFNTDSRILILGSFPSVKSRESQFFYGHPRNRFWDLLATLTGEPLPAGIEEKKSLLLAHHIAVWDVIASCDIEGSSDSSIHNVVPNDLSEILQTASIRQIFTNDLWRSDDWTWNRSCYKMRSINRRYGYPAAGTE